MSDADRERAIDVLKAAFAEGRLTSEEHGARVERVLGSLTYADLAAVSADLPAWPLGMPPRSPAHAVAGYRSRSAGRTSSLAIAALVCGLIPVLPATIAAIVLGIEARRQIRQTGERGGGLAIAGIVLGVLGLLLTVLLVLLLRLSPGCSAYRPAAPGARPVTRGTFGEWRLASRLCRREPLSSRHARQPAPGPARRRCGGWSPPPARRGAT